MPNRDYQEERREYQFSELNRADLSLDPFLFFSKWMDIAFKQGISDPTAMTLSTVSAEAQPKSRIVLLKSFDKNGFVFYTHYDSQKGADLAANNKASLLFFWPSLDRQVRIEGVVEKTSTQVSDDYFHSRPIDSQLAASISHQSDTIPGRKMLEMNLLIAQANYEQTNELVRPEHWGGYSLKPTYFEFWQGRENRLHDRFRYANYRPENDQWEIERLCP